ncbi:MAG: four helix bundle protein [Nitrospirae bacterium]|nr:four helix bundle protein [Nitrospirota bacterium]
MYRITAQFPKEEVFGLTSQMRRSAVSVPSNIAEGAARNSRKEFLQFLYIENTLHFSVIILL